MNSNTNSSGRKLKIGASQSEHCRTQLDEAAEYLRELCPQVETEMMPTDPCDALLNRDIDIAVYDTEAIPQELPIGIAAAAHTPSAGPWECLVAAPGNTLAGLPPGAAVGVASETACLKLLHDRPDLKAVKMVGSLSEQLRLLDDGKIDAMIAAAIKLIRLGLEDRIAEIFHTHQCSQNSQGALAMLTRENDKEVIELLAPLNAIVHDRAGK